ncbi:MAG: ROK family protein [Spirochaetaceae bacterium]|nr:ROK family protein [Spirochaetaceae bacterium]
MQMTNHSDTLDNISYSLVKEAFETGSDFSKKELAGLTQLPLEIVAALIERMLVSGEIKKSGLGKFVINKNYVFYLCIKVKPKTIDCIVFDSTYSEAARKSTEKSVLDLQVQLAGIIDNVRKNYNLACIALSVQLPVKGGIIYENGKVFDLKTQLEQKYRISVFIEKEINLVCFGNISEKQIQFLDDEFSVCLHISETGIQCGLIYKTEVLTGFQGMAGEIGLLNIGGSTLNQMAQNSTTDAEKLLQNLIKTVNVMYNPKTVIVYNELQNSKSESAVSKNQTIIYAADYEAKCESGFIYLIKKRTSIFC